MKSLVKVRVPGACGELLQGVIGGENILIGCSINRHSYLTLERDPSVKEIQMNGDKAKTLLAIQKTLDHFGIKEEGLRVTLASDLLIAKGMASSTADIVSGIIATMALFEIPIDLKQVTRIATSIEPTDPCYFKGILAFNHLRGRVIKNLGVIQNHPIIILDVGGRVETLDFNSNHQLRALKAEKEEAVAEGYEKIVKGIDTSTLDLIGEGMHLSALAHQKILHKPKLEALIHWARKNKKIVGVNIAHSGTLIGVILKSKEDLTAIQYEIKKEFSNFDYLTTTTLSTEGYKIIETHE